MTSTPRCPSRRATALVLGLLTVLSVLLAGGGTSSAAAWQRPAAAKKWTITTSAVGPIELGEKLAKLKKDGYAYYPCGGKKGGHPCYFKGKLGDALAFDVNGRSAVKQVMVNAASGAGHRFVTEHGITVGSTVQQLKAKEDPSYLGNYGYGEALAVHQGKHRWITFFATGTKPGSKVYSIVVSSFPKPIQGR